MSTLIKAARPQVVFDANDPDHRRWYHEFCENRSWGKCPVRFLIDDIGTDLLSLIKRRMLDYYMQKEFKK